MILSEHGAFRNGVAAILRERGIPLQSRPGARGETRAAVAIADVDHVTGDAPTWLRRSTQEVGDAYVVAVGQPTRLAAVGAAGAVPDAMLDASMLDANALMAAARRKVPPPSAQVARMQRVWASITPRQLEVLRLLASGLDNAAIAVRLRVGVRAVKAHVSALLELFSLENRTQLALLARDAGLRPTSTR